MGGGVGFYLILKDERHRYLIIHQNVIGGRCGSVSRKIEIWIALPGPIYVRGIHHDYYRGP